MSGFKSTGPHGFHMVFANGWKASVQFGRGNYCRNDLGSNESSTDCETALISPTGEFVCYPEGSHNEVQGWMVADEIPAFLTYAAAQPSKGV